MSDFLNKHENDGEEEKYTISKAGVEEILGWLRFKAQMCEITHEDITTCDDKDHEIALLMTFALAPWIQMYGIKASLDFEDEEKSE